MTGLSAQLTEVVVKELEIMKQALTGYNGTPKGMTNCPDGDCVRRKNKETYASSVGYDVCICVHAEQNAVLPRRPSRGCGIASARGRRPFRERTP